MQGARDENELIEKFIELIRETGKFPTRNEINLKARRTPGFPWQTTFARFGPKHQFAARAFMNFAQSRPVMKTLPAMCVSVQAPISPPEG